ncbi:hypothetical protein [Paraburkholderia rhizosphaerae]|uniref:Uncharacterized protein n=1 Tax=Paraburkholderia rhizosphaerae TaxID=480658 RepID=A0A4R8LJ33_9BURK|nr:hypothetical protein [Paraburkholderia rhizosphaerae]TDY42249.1 hypothetical protein BX592_12258 [Paraburkholderia rhizosphaerae]
MNPMDQIMEGEVAHLEQIVRMLTVADHIDIKYWERRIEGLKARATAPTHIERLRQLAIRIDRLRNGLNPDTGR